MPLLRLAVLLLLGRPPGERHGDLVASFARRLQEPLLGVAVGDEAERRRSAQDRRHLHVAAREHRGERVAGLVDGDAAPLVGVVAHLVSDADLGDELCLQHVAHGHARALVPQGDDQRLVEQLLDAHRRVTGGEVGDERRGHLVDVRSSCRGSSRRSPPGRCGPAG